MARALCYIATSEDEGKRLDALAAEKGFYKSRNATAQAIEAGKVLVGGVAVQKRHAVASGEAIVYEPDEERSETLLTGEAIDLDIRFEDESLLVISKQAGLVCHPSADHLDGTLVNALIYHCGAENLCDVQGEKDRLGIVHRLDCDTTGLMLAAKTDEAGAKLMADIKDRVVDRRYLALVEGIIPHQTGMIDAPIARDPKERTRMKVREGSSSRDSITTFEVIERFEALTHDDGYTLIECKLFTGRTHQIRVHMNYIAHPCVGDRVYGSGIEQRQLGLGRQFLHSYRIGFAHPVTGEQMGFSDGLPDDLHEVYTGLMKRPSQITELGNALKAEGILPPT